MCLCTLFISFTEEYLGWTLSLWELGIFLPPQAHSASGGAGCVLSAGCWFRFGAGEGADRQVSWVCRLLHTHPGRPVWGPLAQGKGACPSWMCTATSVWATVPEPQCPLGAEGVSGPCASLLSVKVHLQTQLHLQIGICLYFFFGHTTAYGSSQTRDCIQTTRSLIHCARQGLNWHCHRENAMLLAQWKLQIGAFRTVFFW